MIAETKPADASTPNGHDPVTPLAEPPLPGLRVKDYHHQEVFGTAQVSRSGKSRVVLEVVVGGKNQRTETGEVCVAIETEDGKSFSILRAGSEPGLPLTDAAVAACAGPIGEPPCPISTMRTAGLRRGPAMRSGKSAMTSPGNGWRRILRPRRRRAGIRSMPSSTPKSRRRWP